MAPTKPTRKWEICNLTSSALRISRGAHSVVVESNQKYTHNAEKALLDARSITLTNPESDVSVLARIPRMPFASTKWSELDFEARDVGILPWRLYHFTVRCLLSLDPTCLG